MSQSPPSPLPPLPPLPRTLPHCFTPPSPIRPRLPPRLIHLELTPTIRNNIPLRDRRTRRVRPRIAQIALNEQVRIPPAPHDLIQRHGGRIPDIGRDDGRSAGVVGRA